ncbi:unnamed protein product [Symbiodinium necroappetens]|uniref:Uncharacterized protein n=1 Tax=Symbiodinium necroappetens TaxID=1628268 RepID=A0A813B6Q3_9DINO|nr:unnamed protein product [Symbiodinium necroappetens]
MGDLLFIASVPVFGCPREPFDPDVETEWPRRRTKTRSKQKNIKRDTRSEEVKQQVAARPITAVATTSPDLMAPGTSYSVSGWTETTGRVDAECIAARRSAVEAFALDHLCLQCLMRLSLTTLTSLASSL